MNLADDVNDLPIEVPCPQCGTPITGTLRMAKSPDGLPCQSCDAVLRADDQDDTEVVASAQAEIDALINFGLQGGQ
jgi:hypothetical protein